MNEEIFKKRNFVIAEILACASFVLNTFSVVTADRGGPFAPAWVPKFNFIYWLKTILAIMGLFYFFISKVFAVQKIPRYVSISTLIVILYSIPVLNTMFILFLAIMFKIIRGSTFEYEDRIIAQIVWLIPVLIVAIDILFNSARVRKR